MQQSYSAASHDSLGVQLTNSFVSQLDTFAWHNCAAALALLLQATKNSLT